ncbi:fungal-specific transcription factor domain-containing protein [Xylogone sp. PMI_703]|nr:fungal-specific transcription factor domain-containing protein [Xylogone sp. PMI_703]
MLAAASSVEQQPLTQPQIIVEKITRGHSCILCQQRKVRCDRTKPCSNCVKARAECIHRAPLPPRRRKKKIPETDLPARLKRAEELLRKHGVELDYDNAEEEPAVVLPMPHKPNHIKGTLLSEKGNSRILENPLWVNLKEELQESKVALQDFSSDDESDARGYPDASSILISQRNYSEDLYSLHPEPVHIFRLWQTFLVNVNPLVKIFHAPTIQQTILDASCDLENVSKTSEALMFAIYFIATTSLRDEECLSTYGESKKSLITRYFHATQQALINAGYLRSLSMNVLQAYTLFLLALQKDHEPHSFFILSGSAVRIARRLGLHYDGSTQNISPFETEMRRRLWWQIISIDFRAGRLAGAGFPSWFFQYNTKLPSNVSDSDLSPTMTDFPSERPGTTEMMYCSLRYQLSISIRDIIMLRRGEKMDWGLTFDPTHPLYLAKDRMIDELEARFQKNFMSYCDPSIPLHFLTIHTARSMICNLRLMGYYVCKNQEQAAKMTQEQSDSIFAKSLQLLEYDTLCYSNPIVQGYLWYIQSHFQLDPLIYMLRELLHRTTGDMVEKAWQQIKLYYGNHPEMITDTKNNLYLALGNMTIKAWAKREEAMAISLGSTQLEPPPRYISILQAQRKATSRQTKAAAALDQQQTDQPVNVPTTNDAFQPTYTASSSQEPADLPSSTDSWAHQEFPLPDESITDSNGINPMEWTYWQPLMQPDFPAFR